MEYTVKLAQFEGPLDLLLHLISKAKIDLQEIFVAQITEQYLLYMEQIEEIDMDRASEFLNMAATLLYIKSRALLPTKRD
ncbi:MAG: segregation/condensation protein A, partial [Christensenella sp.]